MAAGEELELRAVWSRALAAVAPGPLVRDALAALPLELARRPRHLLAVGKAAYAMLEGAAEGGWIDAVAVGPAEQAARFVERQRAGGGAAGRRLLALAGAHPVPEASSVAAAERLLELVARAPADGLLIALVSGGASAMVAKPRPGGSLAEKIAATTRRMAEGASIAELNALRRSLSAVKGGQLIERCAAPVVSLIVSDVTGDDPRVIASGLTVSSAARPLEETGSETGSGSVRRLDRFAILAGQDAVAGAAASELERRGWEVSLRRAPLVGDVGAVADELAGAAQAAAQAEPRRAIVAYGEPTVRLPARAGDGGRAQQLALLLAQRLAGTATAALIAGTDGVDGPSLPPAAGAIITGSTWAVLAAAGIDATAALARCDARPALAAAGALLLTGPTGCNHADVMILLPHRAQAKR